MSDIPPESVRFNTNLVCLLNLASKILKILQENNHSCFSPNCLEFIYGSLEVLDKNIVIMNFISSSHKYWDKIKKKNESFFIQNMGDIFSEFNLSLKDLTFFKDIFTIKNSKGEHYITEQDKQEMWKLLHGMVKISIKYLIINHKTVENFDMNHHTETWGIKLTS